MATHSVFLHEKSHGRGAWWAIVQGLQRVGHDLVTKQQQHNKVPRGRSLTSFYRLVTLSTFMHK